MITSSKYFRLIFTVLFVPMLIIGFIISCLWLRDLRADREEVGVHAIEDVADQAGDRINEVLASFSLLSNSLTPLRAFEEKDPSLLKNVIAELNYISYGVDGIVLYYSSGQQLGVVGDNVLKSNEYKPTTNSPSLIQGAGGNKVIAYDEIVNDKSGEAVGY